jgi:hypothetical protein
MRSRYCTSVPLDVDGAAFRHLAYSSLTGNLTLVDEASHALLSGRPGGMAGTVDGSRLAFLAERGFLTPSEEQERAAVRQLSDGVEALRRKLLQFLSRTGSRRCGGSSSSFCSSSTPGRG